MRCGICDGVSHKVIAILIDEDIHVISICRKCDATTSHNFELDEANKKMADDYFLEMLEDMIKVSIRSHKGRKIRSQ